MAGWGGLGDSDRVREGPRRIGAGRGLTRVPKRHPQEGPMVGSCPSRAISCAGCAREDPGMQVLPSERAKAGRPSRLSFYNALFAGAISTTVGAALLYIVFGGAFMTRFMPSGRPSTYDLVVGALAWTF